MSAIKRIEKSRSRELLKGTSPLRIRRPRKVEPLNRIRPTAPQQKLVPGRWFTGLGGQQIHLHPDLLDLSIEESHERMYMHRLKDLFLQPDEVWQDHDLQHGNYWRYLKFHFDYMLVASVDVRDPQHAYIFSWYALEYDLPSHGRSPERQVGRQRHGSLIHSRERKTT